MNPEQTPQPAFNWLHLDLKGTVPDENRLTEWLRFFVDCGFNGLVFEYEDRYPWRTWPGTFRPGLDQPAWQRIWAVCDDLNLEVVPLIQVQGHLDWLVKHESYRSLRENDASNEICPNHEEVRSRLTTWIDEIVEIHPSLRYFHLGADETWHLASCPRCKVQADQSADGKLGVYLEHVGSLCEHLVNRGIRPMIWADMFLRENRIDLAEALPERTILVNWQYFSTQPEKTAALATSGREVWGGAGVRNIFDFRFNQAPLAPRLQNIRQWHQHLDAGDVQGLIHTTWGRSASLRPIYGPWEGWLPAFIAAGDPRHWDRHPLRNAIDLLDQGLDTSNPAKLKHLIDALSQYDVDEPMSQRALDWWRLSLRHRLLGLGVEHNIFGFHNLVQTGGHIGMDPDTLSGLRKGRASLRDSLRAWEREARHYWDERSLSDGDEFFDSRVAMPLRLLDRDEAEHDSLALR